MKKKTNTVAMTLLATLALFCMSSVLYAKTVAPTKPLEERVKNAELIFVGKLTDKTVQGDWARAKLVVTEALRGVKDEETIDVIWRIKIGGDPIYDVDNGVVRVALLKDKHEGRYWLRGDKFESLDNLEQIKGFLKAKVQ